MPHKTLIVIAACLFHVALPGFSQFISIPTPGAPPLSGTVVGDNGKPVQAIVKALKVGYSEGGMAQQFADRQGVPAYGFPDDVSGFSSSPSGRSYWYVFGLGGQNLNMTGRDGRPPVRKDPSKPR